MRVSAMNCATYTFTPNTYILSGSVLTGVTNDMQTMVCRDGFTVGGATSVIWYKDYTCTGTAPASNSWSPNPADSQCLGK